MNSKKPDTEQPKSSETIHIYYGLESADKPTMTKPASKPKPKK